MTEDNVAKRQRTRLLVEISVIAILLIFFLAPIIPVEISTQCFVGHPTPLFVPYTDWQSPSYYLLQVGFHTTAPYFYPCANA